MTCRKCEELKAALESLADAYADAILYVPQYFREKWRLDDELNKARAAIAAFATQPPHTRERLP